MQADELKGHHKDDNGERSGKHFPEFAVNLFTQGETEQVDVNASPSESPLSPGGTDFVETIFKFGGQEGLSLMSVEIRTRVRIHREWRQGRYSVGWRAEVESAFHFGHGR